MALLICLVVGYSASSRAHDPYEITSVAYLHSNRIELFVEMEFPTGMTLAGQKPVRDIAVLNQFEAAMPRLRDLAGSFFDLTAGNNVVLPLSTNVELGVEDHIRFQVEFKPTPYRPLRFVARGLGAESSESPYGTSLTVLDMVNQKVLGQTTLFAGSPTAEFPPRNIDAPEPTITTASGTSSQSINTAGTPERAASESQFPLISVEPKTEPNWLVAAVVLGAVFLITFALFRRRE